MKLNTELGFKPVPFSELTDDTEFWKGCEGCINFDILKRNNHKMCLCTGLLYDPAEQAKKKGNGGKAIPALAAAGKALLVTPLAKIHSIIPFRK
jgi:hypothetical protein